MAELTKERLEEIHAEYSKPNHSKSFSVKDREIAEMASQLLASMEQEPVAWTSQHSLDVGDQITAFTTKESAEEYGEKYKWEEIAPLYAAPQLPQPAVVDADDNFYSWFGREWHENYQHNQYTTAAKQMLGVMAESAWRAGHRAAMLQGSEPVSHGDELPMDYQQGHKDGLEWAARLAEANHPQTGDWLYDDPLELAKAIRKGPDMPVEPVQGWIPCSERMPEETTDPDGGATGYLVLYAEGKEPNGGFNVGVWNVTYLRRWWSGFITHWMPLPAAPKQ
ncbi:DUF551 domain-containing protein [Escherichia coli]|nr:DUF551 domain-containing protein [Escherichia coli]